MTEKTRSAPLLTSNLSKLEIEQNIKDLGDEQFWNHNIALPFDIQTAPKRQKSHGKNLVKWERIKPLLEMIDLSNKRVLDIGCNEGFFSLQLAEKAEYVLGGDIDPLRIKKALFVNSLLKVKNVLFSVIDIYSSEFEELDQFDFCICMGFLHRVPDPVRAISAIGKKTDTVLFEWKALKHGHHDEAFAYFSPKSVDENDYYGTEYWLLSYPALEAILRREGFKYFHRVDDPRQRRAILIASKLPGAIFEQPDRIQHRGRIPSLLTHTKRYIYTVFNIINGKLNS